MTDQELTDRLRSGDMDVLLDAADRIAALSRVEAERDALRYYYDDMASKPDCNTCALKDCPYRPRPGETVRANCPLWRGAQGEV